MISYNDQNVQLQQQQQQKRTRRCCSTIDSLLDWRSNGTCSSIVFENSILRRLQPNKSEYDNHCYHHSHYEHQQQIILSNEKNSSSSSSSNHTNYRLDNTTRIMMVPPAQQLSRNNKINNSVTTMSLCNHNRFLLCSTKYGLLSIFDLSPWGQSSMRSNYSSSIHTNRHATIISTQEQNNNNNNNHSTPQKNYEPIQQAMIPSVSSSSSSSSIVSCRWYPADSGAFLTATTNGSIHFWDTNEMKPVIEIQPYRYEKQVGRTNVSLFPTSTTSSSNTVFGPCVVSCMEPNHSQHHTVGVCSIQSNSIKVLDLRTGTSSHTLQINNSKNSTTTSSTGYNTICWSPTNPFVLASGTTKLDPITGSSAVLLWDIRRPGSLAYLTTLDCEYQQPDNDSFDSFHPRQQQQSHHESSLSMKQSNGTKKQQKLVNNHSTKSVVGIAPNNYSINDRSSITKTNTATPMIVSHTNGGGIAQIQFHPSGHCLASLGMNGDLRLWDLRPTTTTTTTTASGTGSSSGSSRTGEYNMIARRFVHVDGISQPSSGTIGVPLHITEHHYQPSSSHGSNINIDYRNSSNDRSMIWTTKGSNVYGYSMEDGGVPRQLLKGHLGTIQCFVPYGPGQMITSATDGLLLLWTSPSIVSLRSNNHPKQKTNKRYQQHHQYQQTSNRTSSLTQTSSTTTTSSSYKRKHGRTIMDEDIDSW